MKLAGLFFMVLLFNSNSGQDYKFEISVKSKICNYENYNFEKENEYFSYKDSKGFKITMKLLRNYEVYTSVRNRTRKIDFSDECGFTFKIRFEDSLEMKEFLKKEIILIIFKKNTKCYYGNIYNFFRDYINEKNFSNQVSCNVCINKWLKFNRNKSFIYEIKFFRKYIYMIIFSNSPYKVRSFNPQKGWILTDNIYKCSCLNLFKNISSMDYTLEKRNDDISIEE